MNDFWRRYFGPRSPGSTSVAMTQANTEYSHVIPRDTMDLAFRFQDLSVAWRYSWVSGQVAGGGGMQMDAGDAFQPPGPLVGCTLYFASAVTGQTMQISYTSVTT